MKKHVSKYTGSTQTAEKVREEIRNRWGDKEAKAYNPYTNCMTYQQWVELDYKVKKGEKSIRSVTFIEKLNEDGEKAHSFPKTIHLFYKTQVEFINS